MDNNSGRRVEFYTVHSSDADSVFGDSNTSESSEVFQPLPKVLPHSRIKAMASDSPGTSPLVFPGGRHFETSSSGRHFESSSTRIISSSSMSTREYRFSSSSSGTSLRDDSFGSLLGRSPRSQIGFMSTPSSRANLFQRRNLRHKGLVLNPLR